MGKLQVFTNKVMLKLNFIIRLNGTIANTIRLCHNTGVEKISCYLLRWRWLYQCTLNSLFAPVVTRREICCQCSFAGAIRVWRHSGMLMGWIANLQRLPSIFLLAFHFCDGSGNGSPTLVGVPCCGLSRTTMPYVRYTLAEWVTTLLMCRCLTGFPMMS